MFQIGKTCVKHPALGESPHRVSQPTASGLCGVSVSLPSYRANDE